MPSGLSLSAAIAKVSAPATAPAPADSPSTLWQALGEWRLFALAACVKLLLLPSYKSTDFEVHRNWLAITHSLPISKWYYEDTSEWTLDYPPFFAWFEWSLSQIAKFFDPNMLDVSRLGYASNQTVLFQRLSVMATEAVFYAGILRLLRAIKTPPHLFGMLLALVFLNPGILFVDHIHFQYNAFMYGIQLFSVARAIRQNKHILGGILFAVVLNFKHIYLYQAPAYFVYLLAGYCFTGRFRFSFARLIGLGLAVVAVFAVSFGPFAPHLLQVLSRLFPFKRGLCHAYWAPNFWALYSFADRALLQVLRILGKSVPAQTASLTRGLVGDSTFAILPNIAPSTTVILTVLSQLPILAKLWFQPTPDKFLDALILCGFGSYMFGWHVHEKAILLILIPLSVVAVKSARHARLFSVLSISGYFSLFPLLFEQQELATKVLVLALFAMFAVHFVGSATRPFALGRLERVYIAGFVPLCVYTEVAHGMVFGSERLAFLPLMITSVYTAVGIVYGWIQMYAVALS
ncbi:glycosyl transferase [Entophlyctis helioformis]|nr:glycosyl transferase [Entophlyctis helioformis]